MADNDEDEQAYRARLQATKDLANKYKKNKDVLNKIKDKAKQGVEADEHREDDDAHRKALDKADALLAQTDATKMREKVKEDIKADIPPPPGIESNIRTTSSSNRSSITSLPGGGVSISRTNSRDNNTSTSSSSGAAAPSTVLMPPPGISAPVTTPFTISNSTPATATTTTERRTSTVPIELVPDHLKSALSNAPPKPPPPPSAVVQKIHKQRMSVDLPDPNKVDFRTSMQFSAPPPPPPSSTTTTTSTAPPTTPSPAIPPRRKSVTVVTLQSDDAASIQKRRSSKNAGTHPFVIPQSLSYAEELATLEAQRQAVLEEQRAFRKAFEEEVRKLEALLGKPSSTSTTEVTVIPTPMTESSQPTTTATITPPPTTTTTSIEPEPKPPTNSIVQQQQPPPPPPPTIAEVRRRASTTLARLPTIINPSKGYIVDPFPPSRQDHASVLMDLVLWKRPFDLICWLLFSISIIWLSYRWQFVFVMSMLFLIRIVLTRAFYRYVPAGLIRERILTNPITSELTVGDVKLIGESLRSISSWIRPPSGILYGSITIMEWISVCLVMLVLGLLKLSVGGFIGLISLCCLFIPGIYSRKPILFNNILSVRYGKILADLVGIDYVKPAVVEVKAAAVTTTITTTTTTQRRESAVSQQQQQQKRTDRANSQQQQQQQQQRKNTQVTSTAEDDDALLKVDQWIELTTKEGRSYWFNPSTSETKWKLFDDELLDSPTHQTTTTTTTATHTTIEEDIKDEPQAPTIIRVATMIYNFQPGKNPQEIAGLINDKIEIYEEGDDGWVTCRNLRTGMIGLAPANYLSR
jgi:hypothetical protein